MAEDARNVINETEIRRAGRDLYENRLAPESSN
jgi:hypothetical protein